jgi:anti-sigma factor RsiW
MTCFQEIHFIKYLDGEMNQKNSKQLEYHIQACQTCKEMLEYLKKEQSLIKDVFDMEEKSIDIRPVFRDRLEKNRSSWLRLAAGILLLGIGLSLFLWFQNATGSVGETEIIVFNTTIEETETESFIYESGDPDVKYIWFEKEKGEKEEVLK